MEPGKDPSNTPIEELVEDFSPEEEADLERRLQEEFNEANSVPPEEPSF